MSVGSIHDAAKREAFAPSRVALSWSLLAPFLLLFRLPGEEEEKEEEIHTTAKKKKTTKRKK